MLVVLIAIRYVPIDQTALHGLVVLIAIRYDPIDQTALHG